MRIFIINPNSDPKMTGLIRETAENFTQGEIEISCELTRGAPEFIETFEDQIKAAPGMIQLIRENEDSADAFIIACHCDPNLDVLKEITRKPVVGIGEASMKIASMLGERFSVISTERHSIPSKETLIQKYNLQLSLASVRAPDKKMEKCPEEEIFFQTAQKAINQDLAEVIVLGCAGLAGLDKKLEKKLGVPVLDGVICALIICWGMVTYGISTSKIRKYNPEY